MMKAFKADKITIKELAKENNDLQQECQAESNIKVR